MINQQAKFGDLISIISGGIAKTTADGQIVLGEDLTAVITGGHFTEPFSIHSPAAVMAVFLMSNNLFISPDGVSKDNSLFISFLPDIRGLDSTACLYDTAGIVNLRTTQNTTHVRSGIQLKVCEVNNQEGWRKINRAIQYMNMINNVTETLDGVNYLIQNASQMSDIIPLGKNESGQKYMFTVNYLLTIKRI